MKLGVWCLLLLCLGGFFSATAQTDSDSDGIPDSEDACPNVAARGDISEDDPLYGCVDIDFDTVPDSEDVCANVPGDPAFNGCLTEAEGEQGIPGTVPTPIEETTEEPTAEPTEEASPIETEEPTAEPTEEAAPLPTEESTPLPTETVEPTQTPAVSENGITVSYNLTPNLEPLSVANAGRVGEIVLFNADETLRGFLETSGLLTIGTSGALNFYNLSTLNTDANPQNTLHFDPGISASLVASSGNGMAVLSLAQPADAPLRLFVMQHPDIPISWRLEATQAIFSPDSSLLIAYWSSGLPPESGESILNFLRTDGSGQDQGVAYPGFVQNFAFNPGGTSLAVLASRQDGTAALYLIDPANPTAIVQTVELNTAFFDTPGIAFNADGTLLAVGIGAGQVQLWETTGWTLQRTLQALPTGTANVLTFNPTGTLLAAGGGVPGATPDAATESHLVLVDVVAGTTLNALRGHSGIIRNLAFSQDNIFLVSTGAEGEIRVWGVGE
jgi:hypothetical protein